MSFETDVKVTLSEKRNQHFVGEASRLEKRDAAEALRSEQRRQEDAVIDSGASKWRYHPPGNPNDWDLKRP